MGDMILCGIVKVVLISESLRQTLESINASGYTLLPAEVKLGFEHRPEDSVFWQLVVTGWGGMASADSGVHELIRETAKAKEFSLPTNPGKLIDSQQYDGSDFFRFWPYPFKIIVKDRIKKLFDGLKIKHCSFYPLSHLREALKMSSVTESTQALPLCLYYHPERAEALGKELGIDWWPLPNDNATDL